MRENFSFLTRTVCRIVKIKHAPKQAKKAQKYSSTLYLTSGIGGGGWSTPRPGHFNPGKDRYTLYRRLGGPQGRSGPMRKISPQPEFDPRTVQPVADRYTDWAIPAPVRCIMQRKSCT